MSDQLTVALPFLTSTLNVTAADPAEMLVKAFVMVIGPDSLLELLTTPQPTRHAALPRNSTTIHNGRILAFISNSGLSWRAPDSQDSRRREYVRYVNGKIQRCENCATLGAGRSSRSVLFRSLLDFVTWASPGNSFHQI